MTNRKALAPGEGGGTAPRVPTPLKTLITLLPVTLLTTRPAVWGCWLWKKVSTLIGYLLTDGLNCLTFKYLAGWHLE